MLDYVAEIRPYSELTPNAPMSGGGARSAEESAPLAGWAAAILLFEVSELP